jgi:hypothetical protein
MRVNYKEIMMVAGPSGKGNADAASGRDMGRNPDRDSPRGGRNSSSGRDRSVASRGLASVGKPGLSKAKGPKSKNKQRNLGNLKDLIGLEDDDLSLNGTSRVPEAPGTNTGSQTESEAYTPEQLEEAGKLRGYDTITENSRRAVARNRSPFAAFIHRLGSFFTPGVNSHLSIDPKTGKLASVDEFDAVGATFGLASVGNPVGKLANKAYQGAALAGYGAPTNTSTRAISDFVGGKQVTGPGALGGSGGFSGGGSGNNNGPNPEKDSGFLTSKAEKPLFERAQQTLYPQEEDKPQLGVGVSQGKSEVRRAPNLSTLNVRRPRFRRG